MDKLIVGAEHDGTRLDRFLVATLPGATRAVARRLLASGAVRARGRPKKKGDRVRQGETIEVEGYVAPDSWSPRPDPDLEIPVLYQDDDMVVVDKPAGIACHPLRHVERGTVASGLISQFPELARAGDVPREAGLVHRLDSSTSGVLIFARRRDAFDDLVAHVRGGSGAPKIYDALVVGDATDLSRITWPLVGKGKRVVALVDGAPDHGEPVMTAETEVRAQRRLKGFTLLEVSIALGRRHQIRAHLAAAGHPIAGDVEYGSPELAGLSRPFLHARQITVQRPSTGEPLEVTAPLAPELQRFLDSLSEDEQGFRT